MTRLVSSHLLALTLVFGAILTGNLGAQTTATWTQAGTGAWETGANWSTDPDVPSNGGGLLWNAVIANGGEAQLGANHEIEGFQLTDGIVSGTGTLTINQLFDWSGGEIDSTSLQVDALGGMLIDGSGYRLSGMLNNFGSATVTTSQYISLGASGVFNNRAGALLDFQSNGGFANTTFGTEINNQAGATIQKSGGSFTTYLNATTFTNLGTLDVQSGTLRLSGSVINGTQTVQAGATLEFGGGAVTLGSNRNISGEGSVLISGGDLTSSTGTFNFNTDVVYDTNTISKLEAGGTIRLNREFTWGGSGNLRESVSNGEIQAFGDVYLTGDGSRFLSTTFKNSQTATWTGLGTVYGTNTGRWENLAGARLTITGDQDLTGDNTGARLINASGAVIEKTGGTDVSSIGWAVDNQGLIDIQSGTLRFDRQSDVKGQLGGTVQIATGARFEIQGGGSLTFDDGLQINGPGVLATTGASNDSTTIEVLGTANVNTAASFQYTAIGGSGNLNLNGSTTFEDSAIATNFSGSTTFNGDVDVLTGGLDIGQDIYNRGHFRLVGSSAIARSSFTWENEAGAVLELANNFGIGLTSGSPVFNNRAGATVLRTAGSSSLLPQFNNYGTVDLRAGTTGLNLFDQYDGLLRLDNATVSLNSTPTDLPTLHGGRLEGNGTIDLLTSSRALVNSGGVIAPGLSAGQLTITGGLDLQAGSQLEFEIGGLQQGTEYDYIDVEGALVLGGVLNLSLIDGFGSSIVSTDEFYLLKGRQGVSGAFAGLSSGDTIETVDGKGRFQLFFGSAGNPYGATNVVVTGFVAVPEPTGVGLLLGLALMGSCRRRRQAT